MPLTSVAEREWAELTALLAAGFQRLEHLAWSRSRSHCRSLADLRYTP